MKIEDRKVYWKKTLEASLSVTLKEVLNSWEVEKVIKEDVCRYMKDYIKQPEVQERIKKATEENVDKLMEGVINTIMSEAQKTIKSNYKPFVVKTSDVK